MDSVGVSKGDVNKKNRIIIPPQNPRDSSGKEDRQSKELEGGCLWRGGERDDLELKLNRHAWIRVSQPDSSLPK